ncbi:hypothetical protein DFS33DRAFT_374594 [Desarmillaria ectypa]|nr:hypothetical protein DFS33DRAFT_374594 [Desarmillaria ectypa]
MKGRNTVSIREILHRTPTTRTIMAEDNLVWSEQGSTGSRYVPFGGRDNSDRSSPNLVITALDSNYHIFLKVCVLYSIAVLTAHLVHIPGIHIQPTLVQRFHSVPSTAFGILLPKRNLRFHTHIRCRVQVSRHPFFYLIKSRTSELPPLSSPPCLESVINKIIRTSSDFCFRLMR